MWDRLSACHRVQGIRVHIDYRSGLGVFRPGFAFYVGAELTYECEIGFQPVIGCKAFASRASTSTNHTQTIRDEKDFQ
ncbi:hypothetical protein Rcae01_03274 [Novipirellula caenicola]|uniref:Uncharacterized protein n=1 Tax=Novipirellula caenicola TaxID=1536901 RepID=A0ABP9VT24_9BACT